MVELMKLPEDFNADEWWNSLMEKEAERKFLDAWWNKHWKETVAHQHFSIGKNTYQPLVDDEPKWAYNEGALIKELRDYCASTYKEHYAGSKTQVGEFISQQGHGEGYFVGAAMKYLARYGKKGGYNRKDLMKIAHYSIMLLWEHDKNHGKG